MKDIALIFASVRPVIVLPTKSQERPSSPFSLLPSRDWRDCRELLFGGTLQTERHFYQPNLLSYQIFISTQLHFFSNFGQSSVLNRSFEIVQPMKEFFQSTIFVGAGLNVLRLRIQRRGHWPQPGGCISLLPRELNIELLPAGRTLLFQAMSQVPLGSDIMDAFLPNYCKHFTCSS